MFRFARACEWEERSETEAPFACPDPECSLAVNDKGLLPPARAPRVDLARELCKAIVSEKGGGKGGNGASQLSQMETNS